MNERKSIQIKLLSGETINHKLKTTWNRKWSSDNHDILSLRKYVFKYMIERNIIIPYNQSQDYELIAFRRMVDDCYVPVNSLKDLSEGEVIFVIVQDDFFSMYDIRMLISHNNDHIYQKDCYFSFMKNNEIKNAMFIYNTKNKMYNTSHTCVSDVLQILLKNEDRIDEEIINSIVHLWEVRMNL